MSKKKKKKKKKKKSRKKKKKKHFGFEEGERKKVDLAQSGRRTRIHVVEVSGLEC